MVPAKSEDLRHRKGNGLSVSLEASSLKMQENQTFPSEWPQETNVPVHTDKNSLLSGRHSPILFYLGLRLIGKGTPMLGRAICFVQSIFKLSDLETPSLAH